LKRYALKPNKTVFEAIIKKISKPK